MRTSCIGRIATIAALSCGAPALADDLMPMEQLGKSIFFDRFLSIGGNQSCADCHAPEAGWTGPLSVLNEWGAVYEGSIEGRFGNRKPPSAAYATPSPILHYAIEKKQAVFAGGNFWDGRATGERLGNPAAEQALGPFLNPLEQALPDSACVVHAVCTAAPGPYPVSFDSVWGEGTCAIEWPADIEASCDNGELVELPEDDRTLVAQNYDRIGLAVAAYEGSPEVNQYSSKYDYFLAGKVDLTRQERLGLNLFRGKGKCANCHALDDGRNGEPPLLTAFTFDNLGVPRNPDNPWYDMGAFNPDGESWIDLGLGGFLASRPDYQHLAPQNYGKHKVPTLRNVDLRPGEGFVKAYMHNGYFKSLEGVVHFYNTRDVKPVCDDPFTGEADAIAQDCWPAPEVPYNVNDKELGRLRLTAAQEAAIVAFLKTLSDGYELPSVAVSARNGRQAGRGR